VVREERVFLVLEALPRFGFGLALVAFAFALLGLAFALVLGLLVFGIVPPLWLNADRQEQLTFLVAPIALARFHGGTCLLSAIGSERCPALVHLLKLAFRVTPTVEFPRSIVDELSVGMTLGCRRLLILLT
jgi:hypothetical protein